MPREVTGYYHMQAWRYSSKTHQIKIIASERLEAAAALQMFLQSRGYGGASIEELALKLKPARSINSSNYVIVADFYKED